MKTTGLQGCFYQRNGRWWWRVKLPDADNIKAIPLKPVGSKFATEDKGVAEEVAKLLWQEAIYRSSQTQGRPVTIAGLVRRYLQHAKHYYRPPSREADNIRYAVAPLVKHFSTERLDDFGPLKLREVQQKMIETGWSRKVVNQRIGIVKRLFKWAAAEQLVSITLYQSLLTVEGLHFGRSAARETESVTAIAEHHVFAALPYTSETVAAMIKLQLLTGMRSTELCTMRPCDIETSGKEIWFYRPAAHKTSYRGLERIVAIGPRGQEVLRPFLKRNLQEYCFSPTESNKERGKARTVNSRYNRTSYRRAVIYAIRAANKAGVDVPEFTPHQLRHSAATKIRKQLGLDAARAALGHRNMKITDDYAELDKALATKAALQCG